VRQLPSKCYTDEVVTLLNQSTPEQFVPSVVKAIQTDERLVELNFDELKQRGLFIQAIDAKGFAAEVKKSLLTPFSTFYGLTNRSN